MKAEEFIKAYEVALKSQSWEHVDPLIHDNACVTFSNGNIHHGKSAIKVAFETNFSVIKSENYSIDNVKWIIKNESLAIFQFDYFWEGIINETLIKGNGIGTSVLICEKQQWVLITESLNKRNDSN